MHVSSSKWLIFKSQSYRYSTNPARYQDEVYSPEFLWLCSRFKIPARLTRHLMLRSRVLPSSTWPALMSDLAANPPQNLTHTQLTNLAKFLGLACYPSCDNWKEDINSLFSGWLAHDPKLLTVMFQHALASDQADLFGIIVSSLRTPPPGVCANQAATTAGLIVMEISQHIRYIINRPYGGGEGKHSLQVWNDFCGTSLVPELTRLLACMPANPPKLVLEHVRLIDQALRPIYEQLDLAFYKFAQPAMMYLQAYLRAADLRAIASVPLSSRSAEEAKCSEVLL